MFKRISFLGLYGLYWTILFQFFRVIFITYHHGKAALAGGKILAQSALYGLRMDVSFAAYILAIPALLLLLTCNRWKWYEKTMRVYSSVLAFILSVLVVVDLELFKAWGFRIDSTSLHYLATPTEAFASMGAAPVFPLLLLLAILFAVTALVLNELCARTIPWFERVRPAILLPATLLISGALVIPIRGGLQQIPLNVSNVFFSDKSFANHAAVNIAWNYMSSFINESYNKTNPFNYFADQDARAKVQTLYRASGEEQQLLRPDSAANVLVIIWESFTAKAVRQLGGSPSVTPEFEKLVQEGVLFTNMYASGNRSDKGMVAILSGYPAQPTQSIIKIPTKTASLPSLPRIFRQRGYFTSFYYGGEIAFANMKSYFLQQGFDHITDKNAFDEQDMNSKWGAHDHIVLKRVLSDLDRQKQPFFTTLFTLSSHEPFEVPVPTVIPGSDPEHLFLNAMHYSDASIGAFIKEAKKKDWWKNTLVVIIADHGHPLPEKPAGKLNEFHIPMLWLGGVVENKGLKVNTLCSQTDLAATLLNQMNLPSSSFSWSNDIMKSKRESFAYFAFNNGFGWVRPEGFVVRDNIGGNIIEERGKLPASEIDKGKAYLQTSFTDFLNR